MVDVSGCIFIFFTGFLNLKMYLFLVLSLFVLFIFSTSLSSSNFNILVNPLWVNAALPNSSFKSSSNPFNSGILVYSDIIKGSMLSELYNEFLAAAFIISMNSDTNK